MRSLLVISGCSGGVLLSRKKVRFSGDYSRSPKNPTLQLLQKSCKSASTRAETDLEHFWNCCSEGFLGERL